MMIGVLAAATAGWTAPACAGFLSATGAVIAIMAGELFLGEAEGHLSGAGTLSIYSQRNPKLTCLGDFTSSAELGGKGTLHCTDGTSATFHFKRLTIRRGYGAGSYGKGSMSFSYGLTPEEARPYLKVPRGKKLTENGETLELVAR